MPAKVLLGKLLLRAGVCPSTWPERWLRPYAVQDSDAGEALFLHQRKVLHRRGKLGALFTRCTFTPVLVDIEQRGVHLDPERAPVIQRKYHAELLRIQSKLDKITGGANPASPKQMREVIFDKLKFDLPKDKRLYTATGEAKTGSDVIAKLKPRNKKQRDFLKLKAEFSKVNGALSKCLNKFTDCINETEDHILTANMNQAITVTQRLSSTGRNYKAQFQNFPREFKPLFMARNEGWLIGEIDQAQLEYRVAVFMGQDEAGLHDILNKVDAHAFTAEHVFAGKWEKLEPKSAEWDELRTEAKSRTFKPLYGGESGTKEEVRYFQAFKKKHKGITAAQAAWKRSALNTGKVRIPSGLEFYFPGTRMLDDGYITNSTNICNYPVQSFATADIVPIGVTYQWHLMRVADLHSFLVNTVHDSAIGEVHPEEVYDYEEIGQYAHIDCVQSYLLKVYKVDFNVPLEIEAKFGRNWAEPKGWAEKHLQ
jgi:DNA polymerase I-like protein with 3'-5' exonuclease and polymerase domains